MLLLFRVFTPGSLFHPSGKRTHDEQVKSCASFHCPQFKLDIHVDVEVGAVLSYYKTPEFLKWVLSMYEDMKGYLWVGKAEYLNGRGTFSAAFLAHRKRVPLQSAMS